MAETLGTPHFGFPPLPHGPSRGAWARYINLAAGAWLCIATVLWGEAAGERWNGWVVGLGIVCVSLVAVWVERVRFVNTAFGVWLLASSLWVIESTNPPTSDIVVAIICIAMSLVPNNPRRAS